MSLVQAVTFVNARLSTALPSAPLRQLRNTKSNLNQGVQWNATVATSSTIMVLLMGFSSSRRHSRRRRSRGSLSRVSRKCSFGEVYEAEPLTTEGEAVVVWLHGLGDTGLGWSETAPLLQQMGLPMLRFIFPTAPARSMGSDKEPTQSWYDVPTLDQDEIARGNPPPGLVDSVEYVLDLIETHVQRGIPPERILIVGYSQGGGLALATALRAAYRFGGVLMLSSWVAEPLPDQIKDVPVHIFHGEEDPVVSIRAAKQGSAQLRSVGLRTTFQSYPGFSHGVNDEEVHDIARTLYQSLH
eukprot:TRINITY_DN79474_c0_g1_i1.p1 TRINITY_DN79474_c0_g1~~TRINITY_DN79474_c0_g1_i1.p1  ORF type:complete len:298 (-),score=35.18 TRINITY_DN79474_c0_g1_i1:42-935(-)